MGNETKKMEQEMIPRNCIKARIYVSQRITKDGTKFNAFKILETATHRRVDLRFTRNCNPPDEDCFIVVQKSNINKDQNRDYPCYWVKEIEDTLPLKLSSEDVSKYFVTDEDNK